MSDTEKDLEFICIQLGTAWSSSDLATKQHPLYDLLDLTPENIAKIAGYLRREDTDGPQE